MKTRTPLDTACLSTVNNTWNQVAMAVAVTRCHPVVCYRQEPRCQRIARPGSTQDCNVSSLPKHIAHSRPLPTRACSAHGYRRIGAPSASTSTHGVAHSRLQRTRVQSYRSKAVPSNPWLCCSTSEHLRDDCNRHPRQRQHNTAHWSVCMPDEAILPPRTHSSTASSRGIILRTTSNLPKLFGGT